MVGQAGASWSEMSDLLARHRVPTRVALDAGLLVLGADDEHAMRW